MPWVIQVGPASSQGPCRRQEAQRRQASGSRKRSENAVAGRWSMGHTLRSVRGFQKLGEQGRGSPLGPREGTGPTDLQAVRSCICHVSLPGVFNCHSGNRERTHTSDRERLEPGPAAGSTGSPVLRLSFLRTRPEGRPHGSPCPSAPTFQPRAAGTWTQFVCGCSPATRGIHALGPRSPKGCLCHLRGSGLSEPLNKVGISGHAPSSMPAKRRPPRCGTSPHTPATFHRLGSANKDTHSPITRLQPVEDTGD